MKNVKRIRLVIGMVVLAILAPWAMEPYISHILNEGISKAWGMGFMTGAGMTVAMLCLINARNCVAALRRDWG